MFYFIVYLFVRKGIEFSHTMPIPWASGVICGIASRNTRIQADYDFAAARVRVASPFSLSLSLSICLSLLLSPSFSPERLLPAR